MSKRFIGGVSDEGMRPVVFALCVCLALLSACQGFTSQPPAGSGVQTHLLNHYEFQQVYFPHRTQVLDDQPVGGVPRSLPEGAQEMVHNPNADLHELFRFQTVVANTGRADAVAAVYVTGYDPNLFIVHPLGPFVRTHEARSCWQWMAHVREGDYSGYAACVREEDMFGLGVSWGDSRSVRFDGFNVNAERYLSRLASWIRNEETNFEDPTGLFQDLIFNCNVGEQELRGAGLRIGSASVGCLVSFGVPDSFLNRPSRGGLALAQYAASIRNCANGCTVVPSPLLPEQYLGGDTDWTPGGERVNLDFGVWLDRNRWPDNYNDHDQLFQFTTCSLYTTYVTPSVCIDPTPGLNRDSKPCVAGNIQIEQHQGAPLRVTRIDQASQGPRVMFTIHVENEQSGTVFYPGAIDFCAPVSPDSLSREFRDLAVVMDARVLGSSERLDCRDNLIRMKQGRGQITCAYDLNPTSASAGAFQTVLNLEIAYLYRTQQTVRTSIHRY